MADAIDRQKALANIANFYREALRRDKAGQEFARALGLQDGGLLDRFRIGYANGSLLQAIPSKGALRDYLREIGLLNAEGQEAATGCLMVAALDAQENIAGFVAIGKDGQERRFPSQLPYICVNLRALGSREVTFWTLALESLLISQISQVAAVPVSAELTEAERELIQRHKPMKAYLGGDNKELLRLLQKLEVPCYRLAIQLPATPAQVEKAMQTAEPIETRLGPDAVVKIADDVLRFECGNRRYELRELAPGEVDRLRVRIRANEGERFYLDTLDLFAGRSRTSFARATAPLYGVSETAIEGDLALMIRKLEAIRAARKNEAAATTGAYVMTADEEAEAKEFLKKPDLLAQVVKDLETLGYVGEEVSKKIGYLITVSRKLDSPLCGVVISRAGAGKSRLLEVLAELVPPEDVVSYTRITPQALYYAENRSLKHKLIISGEDEGLLGSDYALRELISAKRISLAAPVKDSTTGKMKTVEYEVEGPISLLFSTTKPAIHYENATRCFTLTLDESGDQTEQIHVAQRMSRTLDGLMGGAENGEIKRKHRNAQRLIEPLAVVNPFAPELSFPAYPLEMRREHDKYLSLIEAIALLYQHQRERKKAVVNGQEVAYIEVAIEDIEEANRLMTEILGTRADELARPSRELLKLIRKMVEDRAKQLEIEPRAHRFNRRDIREYTGWSDNQIKAHIGQLEELEYLLVGPGDRGRMYRYELAFDGPEKDRKKLPGLTDTAKLRSKVGKLGMVGKGWVPPAEPVSAGKSNGTPVESLKVGQKPKRTYTRA
jgi:energy-coupling factor transporter ATP-binding protein EcfA2